MNNADLITYISTMKRLHIEVTRKLKEIDKHKDAIRKLENEISDIEHSYDDCVHSACNFLRGNNNGKEKTT